MNIRAKLCGSCAVRPDYDPPSWHCNEAGSEVYAGETACDAHVEQKRKRKMTTRARKTCGACEQRPRNNPHTWRCKEMDATTFSYVDAEGCFAFGSRVRPKTRKEKPMPKTTKKELEALVHKLTEKNAKLDHEVKVLKHTLDRIEGNAEPPREHVRRVFHVFVPQEAGDDEAAEQKAWKAMSQISQPVSPRLEHKEKDVFKAGTRFIFVVDAPRMAP